MKGTLQEIDHQQGLKHHIGELCPTCEYFEKVGHVPFPFSDVIPISWVCAQEIYTFKII